MAALMAHRSSSAAVLTIVLFVAVFFYFVVSSFATLATLIREETQRIEEDDPRFDCRTMGNRVCGKDAR